MCTSMEVHGSANKTDNEHLEALDCHVFVLSLCIDYLKI